MRTRIQDDPVRHITQLKKNSQRKITIDRNSVLHSIRHAQLHVLRGVDVGFERRKRDHGAVHGDVLHDVLCVVPCDDLHGLFCDVLLDELQDVCGRDFGGARCFAMNKRGRARDDLGAVRPLRQW